MPPAFFNQPVTNPDTGEPECCVSPCGRSGPCQPCETTTTTTTTTTSTTSTSTTTTAAPTTTTTPEPTTTTTTTPEPTTTTTTTTTSTSTTTPEPSDLCVSSASGLNGTYNHTGLTFNGKQYWEHEDSTSFMWWNSAADTWDCSTSLGGTSTFTSDTTSESVPWLANWSGGESVMQGVC